MIELVTHFLVFALVVVAALSLPLVLGRLIRPNNPNPDKVAVYECGEPTIGSSYIQFDLRFYVVALLFIVFDIEVAFFFPWATVYGVATQLADTRVPAATAEAGESARMVLSERLLSVPPGSLPANEAISAETAGHLAATAIVDVLVFFAVLLVGFAYLWKRGDLDWVRAVTTKQQSRAHPPPREQPAPEDQPTGESPVPAGA